MTTSNVSPEAPPPVADNSVRGATIQTAYVERQVVAYAVLETEVVSLSTLNTIATAFFSAASALVSIAIGIWISAAYAEKLTPAGEVLLKTAAPIVAILAVLCAIAGIWAVKSRRSSWTVVKAQSHSQSKPQ